MKSILWKYDNELGWAYFCPNCKLFLCIGKGPCKSCGQEIDWKNQVEYKGRVKWN
jgi:rRNA maturation endonuclease Nob1